MTDEVMRALQDSQRRESDEAKQKQLLLAIQAEDDAQIFAHLAGLRSLVQIAYGGVIKVKPRWERPSLWGEYDEVSKYPVEFYDRNRSNSEYIGYYCDIVCEISGKPAFERFDFEEFGGRYTTSSSSYGEMTSSAPTEKWGYYKSFIVNRNQFFQVSVRWERYPMNGRKMPFPIGDSRECFDLLKPALVQHLNAV